MWHIHLDSVCSSEGNGVGIIVYSPMGKIHNFSCGLEFACTNNIIEFEALILGIENAFNFGCYHLSVLGDFELIINLVRKIYTPSNKLLKIYTQAVWYLISNFFSFNITHIMRELKFMVDRIVFFASNSSRKWLPQRQDCTFMSSYHPHFPNNVESWQVFHDDERICDLYKMSLLKKGKYIFIRQ